MGIFRLEKMGNALLREEIGPAYIDLVHQVVALHLGRQSTGEVDGGGIVDEDINAAKVLYRFLNRFFGQFFGAHIEVNCEGITTRLLHFFSRRINGAGKFGMRLGGLGRDHDIGAFLGEAEADGLANAAAGS